MDIKYIDEYLSKKILIKKSDLSQLGINIETDKKEVENLSIEFKPFVTMEYFDLNQATYLVLGYPPQLDVSCEDDLFFNTRISILTAVKENKLPDSSIDCEYGYSVTKNERISHVSLEKWAKFYGYKWILPPYQPFNINSTNQDNLTNDNSLIDENNRLKERIIELENRIEEFNTLDDNDTPKRVSAPQKALFSLLVSKNFKGFPSRNSLFEAINIELRNTGLITSDIKPNTLYKFIDDDLEINKKIFPDKQK